MSLGFVWPERCGSAAERIFNCVYPETSSFQIDRL
jgi:hypothetical protein